MHTTFHYAMGVIVASITYFIEEISFIQFGFIVFFAFGVDFDIFLIKYTQDNNHRNFFTHSIFLPALVIIIGFIFDELWIIMAGFAYLTHILSDMLDWGLYFWYFNKKTYGINIFLRKYGVQTILDIIEDYHEKNWFFIKTYYSSRMIWFIEILTFNIMVVILIFFTRTYFYFGFGYLVFLFYHIHSFHTSKRKNNKIEDNSKIK